MQTSSVSTKTINSDSSETELNIFTNNMPDVSAIEKSVVKWLVDTDSSFQTEPNSTDITIDSAVKNKHIRITSSLPNSDVALSIIKTDNDEGSSRPTQEVITHLPPSSTLYNNQIKNVISLNETDSDILYTSSIRFKFEDGGNMVNNNSNTLTFDDSNPDYNLYKAINSPYTNTDENAENGITVSFDNTWNNNHSFYTEHVVNRSAENQLTAGNSYGTDGISTNLDYSILSTNDEYGSPYFGSFKVVQQDGYADFDGDYNNTVNNSTMSRTSTDLDNVTDLSVNINVQRPWTSLNQTQFKELFSNSDLQNIYPGYTFQLTIGNETFGGYSLENISENDFSSPIYANDNTIADYTNNLSLFSLNDDSITENIKYMLASKTLNAFDSEKQKLHLKNGTFTKNANHSSIMNYDNFEIRDGFETLSVTGLSGLADLSKSGVFRSYNTNNNIADEACRYTRYENSSSNVSGLVVSYDSAESDYISSVGVITEQIKTTPIVETEIHVLTKSTVTSDGTWSDDKDYEMNNDAILVRQTVTDNTLYDKTNISNFDASGLNNMLNSDEFALLQVFRSFDVTDTDTTTLFKTSDNKSINGVKSFVGVSNVNFNQISADDLRVILYGKQITDLPSINTNDGLNVYYVTSSADGNLSLDSNGYDTNNNGNYISLAQTPDNPCLINNYFYNLLETEIDVNITFKIENSPDVNLNSNSGGIDSLGTNASIKFSFTKDGNTFEEIFISQVTGFIGNVTNNENFRTFNTSINTTTEDISLVGLGLKYDDALITVNNNYKLVKTTYIKTYDLAIRNVVTSFNNVWVVFKEIKEITILYDLYSVSGVGDSTRLRTSFMRKIKYINNDPYPILCTRRFILPSNEIVTNLQVDSMYRVKDFFGFRASVEYHTSSGWLPFTLETNIYDNHIDALFESDNRILLNNPNNDANGFGTIELSFTINENVIIGDVNHISTTGNTDNKMYIIHLSTPSGLDTLSVVGYKYNTSTDIQYLNNNSQWDPYSDNTNNNFLLYNNGNNVGTEMNDLIVKVSKNPEIFPIDTTYSQADTIVEIYSGETLIISYKSNSRILEDFNIIKIGNPLVQIINRIGEDEHTNYIQTSRSDGIIYAKSNNGIRANIEYNSEHGDFGKFRLLGDILKINPLDDATEETNIYNGRYSSPERIDIEENYPLSTNSTIHRNIYPTMFRGYKNSNSGSYSEIEIIRTPAYVKFAIDDVYQSDLGDETNVSIMYKDREFVISNIYSEENSVINDMSVRTPNSMDVLSIGGIGLKILTSYSMFPTNISSTTPHTVPIVVNCADYTKVVSNPNNSTVTTNSSVADVNLHSFDNESICATRVKVYEVENLKFEYLVPDMEIYHSPKYVIDARTEMDWSLLNTFTDADIRDGRNVGVVRFTRVQNFVESYTNYANAPRPSMYVSSYDITDIPSASLPQDLSELSKKTYYTDILNNNTHTPFNKSLHGDEDNQENAINSNDGLNNIAISLDIDSSSLSYRYDNLSGFSFTIPTNKLTIDLGVGITSDNPSYASYSLLGQNYISDMLNPNLWNVNTDNIYSSNLWNLKFSQPSGPLNNYSNIDESFFINKFVYINGFPPFGLGTYYIDIVSSSSTQIKLFTFDYDYNYIEDTAPNDEPLIVNFYRYSSTNAVINPFFDVKTANFNPIIFTKEKMVYTFNVSNLLENDDDEPINLMDRIKQSLVATVTNTSLNWVSVEDYDVTRCPVKISILDKTGVTNLNDMLFLDPSQYYKLLLSRRPDIMLVNDAMGLPLFRINHDGNVLTKKVYVKSLNMVASKPPETYIDQEPSNLAQQFYIDSALGK